MPRLETISHCSAIIHRSGIIVPMTSCALDMDIRASVVLRSMVWIKRETEIETVSGICPLGQEPYEHPITGRSMKCDPMRPVSECPSDFSCTPAVPGASWGFCCSLEIKAQCPSGTRPYLEPITHHPVKCTVGVSMCG